VAARRERFRGLHGNSFAASPGSFADRLSPVSRLAEMLPTLAIGDHLPSAESGGRNKRLFIVGILSFTKRAASRHARRQKILRPPPHTHTHTQLAVCVSSAASIFSGAFTFEDSCPSATRAPLSNEERLDFHYQPPPANDPGILHRYRFVPQSPSQIHRQRWQGSHTHGNALSPHFHRDSTSEGTTTARWPQSE
jgi:hypothetical protein